MTTRVATGRNYSLWLKERKIHQQIRLTHLQADGRAISKSLGFQVAERDVDISKTGVEHAAPVAGATAGTAAGFRGPLAFDATCGVGQGVEASDWNAFAADLALAVSASF